MAIWPFCPYSIELSNPRGWNCMHNYLQSLLFSQKHRENKHEITEISHTESSLSRKSHFEIALLARKMVRSNVVPVKCVFVGGSSERRTTIAIVPKSSNGAEDSHFRSRTVGPWIEIRRRAQPELIIFAIVRKRGFLCEREWCAHMQTKLARYTQESKL